MPRGEEERERWEKGKKREEREKGRRKMVKLERLEEICTHNSHHLTWSKQVGKSDDYSE